MGKGNVGENWNSCCEKACAFGISIGGTEYSTNEVTIRRWNVEFRTHEMFLRNESILYFSGIFSRLRIGLTLKSLLSAEIRSLLIQRRKVSMLR